MYILIIIKIMSFVYAISSYFTLLQITLRYSAFFSIRPPDAAIVLPCMVLFSVDNTPTMNNNCYMDKTPYIYLIIEILIYPAVHKCKGW